MINKRIFIVALMTFLTLVAWAVFDILHAKAAVKVPPQVEQLLEPVNPNFDQQTINEL